MNHSNRQDTPKDDLSDKVMRITLMEDWTLGLAIDYCDAGAVRYWKILKQYENGDMLIERKGDRALLWKKDIEAGERHSEPNFSMPLGLHLKLEVVDEPGWWTRWWHERRGVK